MVMMKKTINKQKIVVGVVVVVLVIVLLLLVSVLFSEFPLKLKTHIPDILLK
jgi:hypothetical protein